MEEIQTEIWITLIAAALFIVMMARGYKRGIIVELSGLIALIISFFALIFLKPYTEALPLMQENRLLRAMLYLLFAFLIFKLVNELVKKIGKAFRKIPVIGWAVGVLGAVAGCLKSALMVLIFEHATGIGVISAVSETLDKLPVDL